MKVQWQENGIVLTAVAVVAAALLIVSEQLVAGRVQSAILVTIDAGTDGDEEGDERTAAAATVPLYGSLTELTLRAQQLLAEPEPNVDLLHELARQARVFRAFPLAEPLLARCLELAPGRTDLLFMRARNESDLGHPELAMQMYEVVLAQTPNHQKATYNLGVLARRAGDLNRAEILLTRAISISSGRVKSKALNQLGLAYAAAGRWDQAVQSLTEAANLRPDMARFWLDLGNAEQKRGRLNEAQADFDKALALNRRFADAQVAMGLLQEQRGNQARALSHLMRAVKLDRDNTEYRKALAHHYLAAGDSSRAREEFGWLSRSADNDADRAFAQSMLALLDHESDRMLSELRRANALRPGGYDDAVGQAAILLHEKRHLKEARALLDMLLARPTPTPELQLATARTASRLGQWADAEVLLRRSLKSQPQSSEAWFQLGRVLSERGDLAGAIDAYRKSLERNPDARNTRLNLAILQARSGNEREALGLYERLLKDHPRYTPALVNRARLHERAGRNPEALADLEMAMGVAPGDPAIRARLAELLLRQGQTERARVLLTDAVAESPADPEVRLLLADTELRAGHRADALKELGRAAALAGDDPRIWSSLAQRYRDAGDAAAAAQASSRATKVPGAAAPPKASP